ncbi:MAG: DUF3285 domain-containing protein [Leptolyngbyaceae bacterium]|nr:DUF3285 domain-containing protein [Leptolyngbyaceae bacterium]
MTDPTLSPYSRSELGSEAPAPLAGLEPEQQSGETAIDGAEATEPTPSYVKLAMRNMVRKGGKSLFHFFLTTTGLIGLFVGLAYLTR